MAPDFSTVTEFENRIAEFFGAPYAVMTDSCTSAIELCLRYKKEKIMYSPRRTYLSIPMLAEKLGIKLVWHHENYVWKDYYPVVIRDDYTTPIYDAAVLWRKNSYEPNSFMCLSFQRQKHLSLGKAGMILCDNKEAADMLKLMSYDGRQHDIPWRNQDVSVMGYHYAPTFETAALGLSKLDAAIATEPRQWVVTDWPDLTQMKIFKQ